MADETKTSDTPRDTSADAKPVASARHGARRDDERGPRSGSIDDFNLLTLDELAALAEERGVKINTDVWRAHMITELRAHQTGARPGQG
jgi:hypothetical protein